MTALKAGKYTVTATKPATVEYTALTKTFEQLNRNFGVAGLSSISDNFTLNSPKSMPKNIGFNNV